MHLIKREQKAYAKLREAQEEHHKAHEAMHKGVKEEIEEAAEHVSPRAPHAKILKSD